MRRKEGKVRREHRKKRERRGQTEREEEERGKERGGRETATAKQNSKQTTSTHSLVTYVSMKLPCVLPVGIM